MSILRLRDSLFACILLLTAAFFSQTEPVYAATVTWDGGGADTNWSTCQNWSGDSCPGVADVATFNATSTKNASIDANISVAGLDIQPGYSGTITQNSSMTITVGSSNWNQEGGTFSGGDSTIDINGTFTLSGSSVFTSTTGMLEINSGNTSVTLFQQSGGTFNHNGGSVKFDSSSSCGHFTMTIDVDSSITFHHLELDTSNVCSSATYNTGAGDTVTTAGTFTYSDSSGGGRIRLGSGTWEAQGNIVISGGDDDATGTLTVNGSGNQEYTYSSGNGPRIEIDKATGTVTPAVGMTNLNVNGLTLTAGNFTAPTGTLTIAPCATSSETVLAVANGTTLTHNNGTVSFMPDNLTCSGLTFTIDVDTTLTLNHVIAAATQNCQRPILTTAAGDTIIAAGNLTFGDEKVNGSWEARGDVTIEAAMNGGSATLTFSGNGNQTYTDNGGDEPDGNITIAKTGGAVVLASSADWNATGQDLALTGGTLDLGGYDLSVADQFTITGTGTLRLHGNESLSGGPDSIAKTGLVYYDRAGETTALKDISYGSLIIGSSGSAVYHLPTATLDINGDLTLSGGTLAVTAAQTITLSGSWLTDGGAFSAGTGTVTLNGGIQTLSGSTTFYNLAKTTSSPQTLTFAATTTQTITNALTLEGAAGNLLTLQSSQGGTQWKFDPQGTHSINQISVSDSNNINATAIDCSSSICTDGGNNTNWTFSGKSSTSTALTSNNNPATFGENIVLTATITPSDATGTVTFQSGATVLGTATIGQGSGSLTVSDFGIGAYSLTATYGGDANYEESTSAALSQVVDKIVTTTTLASSDLTSTFGQFITLTATVSPSSASGTVTFQSGATLLGTATVGQGSGSLRIPDLAAGANTLTAVYGGNATLSGSTSSTVSQVVSGLAPSLLMESDLQYGGAFRVPDGTFGGSRFGFGGRAVAFRPNTTGDSTDDTLLVSGHAQHDQVAEISIPTPVISSTLGDLNTATVIQNFADITDGKISQVDVGTDSDVGGVFTYGNRLIWTAYSGYDANAAVNVSHGTSSFTLSDTTDAEGMFRVGSTLNPGYYAGYMTPVPAYWQSDFGVPVLTGQSNLNIITRTSAGPAAFGFDPDDLGVLEPVPDTSFLYYTSQNPLRGMQTKNDLFNYNSSVGGLVFSPQSRSVLFFGGHATGEWCYGDPEDCNDTVRGGKGNHDVGSNYVLQVWAYDAVDLLAVKNGELNPWDLEPYAVWRPEVPISVSNPVLGGVAYDPETERIFVAQMGADTATESRPLIHVYQIQRRAVEISSLSPADNTAGITTTANLVITFNDTIGATGTGTVTIKKAADDSTVETINVASGPVTGTGTTQITINPTANLDPGTAYYVQIHPNAFPNLGGNSFAGISDTTTWNFTTLETGAPTVSTLSPADNATGVATTANLVISFNESVLPQSGVNNDIVIKQSSDNSTVETIDALSNQVTGSGTAQITVNPSVTLAENTSYYVQIGGDAFDDTEGTSFAGINDTVSWNFTTTDSTNPTVSSFSPVDNATGVATTANLVIHFSEPVDAESGNLTIKQSSDNSIVETIDVTSGQVTGGGTDSLTVNPGVTLENSTAYYVQIASTAFDDAAGNSYPGISDTTTWNFTTVSGDVAPPDTFSLSPADNATGVATTANLVISFNESVLPQSGVNNDIVIKQSSDNSTV
ncbi:Ig-like domain-containing protein [Gimesia aquarii]|uniref:Copper resistance protein CopC n=1 Tax=Gimesia aquarii TaxID=2527964 RepID=A0A517X060_9PLAN|nr:Copper resistance protein CopC [Gimesia aquarii]